MEEPRYSIYFQGMCTSKGVLVVKMYSSSAKCRTRVLSGKETRTMWALKTHKNRKKPALRVMYVTLYKVQAIPN